jgi:hypothetical protein
MLRVSKWLETLSRTSSSDDFQAVHTAARSIFETSIDLVLIFHEEKGSVRKVLGWQQSSKLRALERLRRLAPDSELLPYIRLNEASILAEREALWGLNKNGEPNTPERWTKRNLEQDAIKAESYFSGGFVRFYAERYASTCWYVHGSGVTGIWELPDDRFANACSLAIRDAHNFALVCVEYALRLFDSFDEISEARIGRLNREMIGTFDAIWKQGV